jgi:hypothetical protein
MRVVWISFLSVIAVASVQAKYNEPVDPDIHMWFERQTSHDGHFPCCSEADGHVLNEEDWRVQGGKYQVFLEDRWWDVPREAIVDPGKGANPIGKPVVWYRHLEGYDGPPHLDCFCPGTMG